MDGFVSTKMCAAFHLEDQVSNRQEALDNYWLSRRWVARGAHFVSRRCQDHRDLCISGKEIWWVLKWLFNAGYYVGFFVWHALGLGVFVQHNLETNGTLRPTTMSPTWATWTTFKRYSLHLSLQSLPSLGNSTLISSPISMTEVPLSRRTYTNRFHPPVLQSISILLSQRTHRSIPRIFTHSPLWSWFAIPTSTILSLNDKNFRI